MTTQPLDEIFTYDVRLDLTERLRTERLRTERLRTERLRTERLRTKRLRTERLRTEPWSGAHSIGGVMGRTRRELLTET
jgi:hypothetical protein